MSSFNNLEAIVLAGGKGERMKSEVPKLLNTIGGKPMIFYTLEKLIKLKIKNIIVVIGYQAEAVKLAISQGCRSINLGGCRLEFAHQQKPLGTADAVKAALPKLDPKTQTILVLNGDDSAFYSQKTLQDFLASHLSSGNTISAITTIKPAAAIGRIVRDKKENFLKILEFNDYQKSGLSSDDINCGAYLFDRKWLEANIDKVKLSQKGEYYLTDLLNIASGEGLHVNLFRLKDPNEWHGINTQKDLKKANQLIKR